jgi:hypothetical protein
VRFALYSNIKIVAVVETPVVERNNPKFERLYFPGPQEGSLSGK